MENTVDYPNQKTFDDDDRIQEVFWAPVQIVKILEDNFRLSILDYLNVKIVRQEGPKLRWGQQKVKISFTCPKRRLEQVSAYVVGVYWDFKDAAPQIFYDAYRRWRQRPKQIK